MSELGKLISTKLFEDLKVPADIPIIFVGTFMTCLLYTSDAADERSSVDLGGRRIIKKKNRENIRAHYILTSNTYIYT